MDIPITNPHLSANLEDNSKIDDSFKQQGTTVNLGSGATYNQNCGNQHEFMKNMSTWFIILVSLICDIIIVFFMIRGFDNITNRLERFDKDAAANHLRLESQSKEFMKQAKEGTIWILRDDLIKSMDIYEAKKTITQKQYKRLKDEFDYYTSIGGNHDVKDRWDDFNTKLYGLDQIKMVSDNPEKR